MTFSGIIVQPAESFPHHILKSELLTRTLHEFKMVQQRGAKGDAVAAYRESFATKLMGHFQLARRVKKTENSLTR